MEEFLAGNCNYLNIKIISPQLQSYLDGLEYQQHLFIESSGTGNKRKIYSLSRSALVASATDVNNMLHVNSTDRWMCPLCTYHIGGFSIAMRAHLSNTPVDYYQHKWSPSNFYKYLIKCQSTLLSLVPSQLFDLVSLKLISPPHLRAVIIGGDTLPNTLAQKAIELGWPIYHTYGMTEFCSQVATSKYSENGIDLLPNFEVKIIEKRLAIKSQKMFTSIITEESGNFSTQCADDFCSEGYYLTQDRGEVIDGKLIVKGREDKLIKLKGHFIDLAEIEEMLHNHMIESGKYNNAVLKSVNDPRLGSRPLILSIKSAEADAKKAVASIVELHPILSGILEVELVDSAEELKLKRPYL